MHSAVVSSADFVVLHLTAHFLVEFGVKCFVHDIVVVTRFCCLLFGCAFDWNLWPILTDSKLQPTTLLLCFVLLCKCWFSACEENSRSLKDSVPESGTCEMYYVAVVVHFTCSVIMLSLVVILCNIFISNTSCHFAWVYRPTWFDNFPSLSVLVAVGCDKWCCCSFTFSLCVVIHSVQTLKSSTNLFSVICSLSHRLIRWRYVIQ